jgi:hypothetical protein
MTHVGDLHGRRVYIDRTPASIEMRRVARGAVPLPADPLNSRPNADLGVSASLAPAEFSLANPGIPRPYTDFSRPDPLKLPPKPEPAKPHLYTPPAPRPTVVLGSANRPVRELPNAVVVPVPRANGPVCLEAASPADYKPIPVVPNAGNTGMPASESAAPDRARFPNLFVDLSARGFEIRAAVMRERYGPDFVVPPPLRTAPTPAGSPAGARLAARYPRPPPLSS